MDPDTSYRMIIALGSAIPIIIIGGLLWPRKHPQKHYDSPLLRLLNKSSLIVTEEPPVSIDTDNTEAPIECPLCHVSTIDPLNPHLTGLDQLIECHYGKSDTYELADKILLYYKEYINNETTANVETICDHINGDHISQTLNK